MVLLKVYLSQVLLIERYLASKYNQDSIRIFVKGTISPVEKVLEVVCFLYLHVFGQRDSSNEKVC